MFPYAEEVPRGLMHSAQLDTVLNKTRSCSARFAEVSTIGKCSIAF